MSYINCNDPFELAKYIKNAPKKTNVKVYICGKIKKINFGKIDKIITKDMAIIWGDYKDTEKLIIQNKKYIKSYYVEGNIRNSAVPLLDVKKINARIEPGAIIRDGAIIKDRAIIMMGAVVNIGAEIGEETMIDMNAVIGARAIIGKGCHIGAGAVIAGVIEPAGACPVRIGNNVLIGANAVVLEGIKIGNGAVIGAGAVVTKNIEPKQVVVGNPAVKSNIRENVKEDKIKIVNDLREN